MKLFLVIPIVLLVVATQATAQQTASNQVIGIGTATQFDTSSSEVRPLEPIVVQYPMVARRAGLQGRVFLRVKIDTNGVPLKVVIDRADYDEFSESAKDAIMKARFTPAVAGGKRIEIWVPYALNFMLGPAAPARDTSSSIRSGAPRRAEEGSRE